MLAPTSRASSLAYTFLYVALAGIGAIQLFHFVLDQYAIAGFWQAWVAEYPIAGTYVPFAAIAFACGIIVGLVVGALAGVRANAIAAWAGLGACVLSFLAATVVGGVQWALSNPALIGPLCIAVGLLLGALLGRKIRYA